METIKINGLAFEVDCNDWKSTPNEPISDIFRGILAELPPEDLRALHARDLARRSEDSEDRPFDEIMQKAYAIATEGWASEPQSGHNCLIRACKG